MKTINLFSFPSILTYKLSIRIYKYKSIQSDMREMELGITHFIFSFLPFPRQELSVKVLHAMSRASFLQLWGKSSDAGQKVPFIYYMKMEMFCLWGGQGTCPRPRLQYLEQRLGLIFPPNTHRPMSSQCEGGLVP